MTKVTIEGQSQSSKALARNLRALFSVLILLLTGAGATSARADATCADLPILKSKHSKIAATMIFQSLHEKKYIKHRIYWINFSGKRELKETLHIGGVFRTETFLTHPWVISRSDETGNETCHQVVTPKPGVRVIVLSD